MPYPLPKLDMIAITEFANGAMENWGLVTYRVVDLLIDADTASAQQKQRVDRHRPNPRNPAVPAQRPIQSD